MALSLLNFVVFPLLLLALRLLVVELSSQRLCDFDCVHGRCNRQTRKCVCASGWTGADCDLCPVRVRCPVEEPALALILPQAAPIEAVAGVNRSVDFVSAFGISFPKGWNGRYNCLFGPSLSKGRWVSPSLVQCPVPTKSLTGKYAFSMAPDGSTAYIPNQADGGTSHFTLFVPCSPDECRGRCLGPLCLCLHSQSGNLCEVTPPTTENSTIVKVVSNNNTAVTWATEFHPYTTKIPNWNELSRVSVQSDIGVGLTVDLLSGTLNWPSPLGRLRPYSIEVRLKTADGANSLVKWALRVKPSYSAQLDRAESFAEKVIWKEAKAALNGSIPLLLRILASESERRYVVEDIILWTEPSVDGQKFRHVLYPYLDASEIAITSVHPGAAFADSPQTLDETDAVEWAQQRVAVGGFDAELSVREGQSFEHNYSLRMAPLGGNCSGQWHFEVIEPRELFSIGHSAFERDGENVRLSFRPLLPSPQSTAPSAASLMLKTAFICMPMGQSQIIRQTLKGIGTTNSRREDGLGVAMDPQRLFVDVAGGVPSQSLSVFTLDVSVPSRRAELLQRVHLESASFSPFELVWLSRPSPTFWRLWLSLKADQMGQEGNSDGVLLIRGGKNLALSLPYRIQRTSNAQSNAFLFTLTIKDSSSKANNPHGHPSPATAADVQLFTQRNGQHFFRTVPFDVPEQFGPLRSDIFQLRIRSRQFRPFSSLIKVDPLNNALIVELRRMPTQYFADDGKTFAVEWEELDGTAVRPRVRLSPLVISDANLQQFVDIVYTDGPPKSFVWLSPDERQPLMGLPIKPNFTLCLGCGFRQPLRLRSLPSVPSHCGALSVALPFSASVPSGGSLSFRQFLLITRSELNDEDGISGGEGARKGICYRTEEEDDVGEAIPVPQLARRSPIFRSCPKSKLRRCQSLFRPPGPKCQHWWAQLPDDLLTVHTVAQFLLLSVECRREGAGLERMEKLIECITSVDNACPLHPSEVEMAPHRGGQLFNQIGHLKPFRVGLQSLFPALSLVESQLISFPSLLGEFLSQLSIVFPPSALLPLSSPDIFDQFIAAIADNSTEGPIVEGNELRGKANELIVKWNRVVNLVSGREDDLPEGGSSGREDDLPEGGSSGREDDLPEGGSSGREDDLPEGGSSGREDDLPEGGASGREDDLPEGGASGREDDLPEGGSSGREDDLPEGGSSGREDDLPEGGASGREDDLPEGGASRREDDLPKGGASGREDDLPKGGASGREDDLPEGGASGREDDLPEGGSSGRELAQWRALVQSADRIKSIARQFGAENPFSLFRDVLRQIFSNAEFRSELNPTPEDYQNEEIVGWADVRAEREEVQEGEEFRVLVNVRVRELTPAVLSSVSVNLRFTRTSAPLKFRLGPIFSSGQPLELRADGTFRAEWTVLPFSDFRLTESTSVKPDIVLSFELGGERKAQRLNAPSVLIRPRPALRLLAFSLPTLPMASSAHSLHISAVNSGYSELNSVEFCQLRPEIRWANDGTPADFRFSNVHVEGPDGHILPEGSFLSFGHKIASGSASHMTLNFSVMPHKKNSVALFHNFSAVVSVNSSLLPLSQFDLRFFFIQQSIRPHSLLLVSEYSSPLPLYLYSKPDSKLTPLATLQLIEEKEVRSVLNGHRFLSRVYALRRLGLFSSPMGPDGASVPSRPRPRPRPASSSFSSLPIASVFATLPINTTQTFANGAKLLRVSEMSENRKRQIDRQLVWIGGDSDEKMMNINFVDLDASAAMPQLAVYQLQFDFLSSISPAGHQEVLGRITAISPQDSPLNYSIRSPQKESPFSVVPSTGDIVITYPLPTGSAEHCLNLVATDQKGMQTRVPVQILLEAMEQSENRPGIASEQGECKLYSVETKLFEHEFEKTRYQTTEEAAAEAFSNKTLADESQTHQHSPPRPNVVEMGGDSTLSPISFSPDVEEEATATPAVPSPFAAVGVSPTAGRSFPTHSHQQFLTAYPHRTVYSTTKAPLPALQLAGLGTGSQRTAGIRRNGTGRIRIGAAGAQREEGRTVEGGQSSAQTMAEMACRLRTTKPIWALICDMAKTVYRTTI
uniref:EGF-like domain-containing protein n=1 Tax=Globodera rostochiensis TaxID=31243 RepID=A0A914GTQ2_GLORO